MMKRSTHNVYAQALQSKRNIMKKLFYMCFVTFTFETTKFDNPTYWLWLWIVELPVYIRCIISLAIPKQIPNAIQICQQKTFHSFNTLCFTLLFQFSYNIAYTNRPVFFLVVKPKLNRKNHEYIEAEKLFVDNVINFQQL